jgi:asparagine synthase (glutamine-hydrolysing)
MHRYLALFWDADQDSGERSARTIEARLLSSSTRWSIAYRAHGILVAHSGATPGSQDALQLADDKGIVIGTVFRKSLQNNEPTPLVVFDRSETTQIVASGCEYLVRSFWGKYVAIIRGDPKGPAQLVRDPTSMQPCFHARSGVLSVFFSHVEDWMRYVPGTVSINALQLTRHLISNFQVVRETGLNEIEDIPGGERQDIVNGRVRRTALWYPARFARESLIEDEGRAAGGLEEVVQNAVDAWALCHKSVLHCLSGGLDSSIIAGCLARSPSRPNVTCFNIFIGASEKDRPIDFPTVSKRYLAKLHRASSHGDEREFARLAAALWKFPLVEEERSIARIRLADAADAPLATLPSRYVQYIDQDKYETSLLRQTGATAVFNGQGGDELFFSTLHPIGAIDYAYSHGMGRRFSSEVSKACKLSQDSMWLVLWECFKFGLLGRSMPHSFDTLGQPHLLKESITSHVTEDSVKHPWERLIGALPPGKRFHAEAISGSALHYHDVFHRENDAPSIYPLVSQPVVEYCMRVPMYVLQAGGVSRGLARRAFKDILPERIRKRITKGYTFSFANQLVRDNMRALRECLLNGELVENGIMDSNKVARYLVPDQTFREVSSTTVLLYFAAEMWLRQWKNVVSHRAAA